MSLPLVRSVVIPGPAGPSAVLYVREAPDPGTPEPVLEAGVTLGSDGVPPFSMWARFSSGERAAADGSVIFRVGGLWLSDGSFEAVLPWAVDRMDPPRAWAHLGPWAVRAAVDVLGHPEVAARAAVGALLDEVLSRMAGERARFLVRQACAIVPPSRAAELVLEAAAFQVMSS